MTGTLVLRDQKYYSSSAEMDPPPLVAVFFAASRMHPARHAFSHPETWTSNLYVLASFVLSCFVLLSSARHAIKTYGATELRLFADDTSVLKISLSENSS